MKIEKINSYLARDQFIVEIITDKGISELDNLAGHTQKLLKQLLIDLKIY